MTEPTDLRPAERYSPDEYDHGTRNPARDIFVARRPWGKFQQFVSNETVTVKIITVEPGHRLSLQRHTHRGEMWQVLDVPIDICVGDERWTAQPGETIWVPHGAVHRMGNSGTAPGRLLEVAFGHFDELDIERLEDDYARQDGDRQDGDRQDGDGQDGDGQDGAEQDGAEQDGAEQRGPTANDS